jgi:P27 family predicted phage terminase small subunit
VFEGVSQLLYDIGVLTEADACAVEGLSQAYCDWRDAVEFLDRNGRNYVVIRHAPDGTRREELKPYPEVAIASNADKRLRAWMQSCGLTPIDRPKISRLYPKTGDDFFGDL